MILRMIIRNCWKAIRYCHYQTYRWRQTSRPHNSFMV